MNHFRKVSQPCLTTRGFTALRCPFGATLSLVRHGLASFDLQTFLRTKTVNKKVSTFKGALTFARDARLKPGISGNLRSTLLAIGDEPVESESEANVSPAA